MHTRARIQRRTRRSRTGAVAVGVVVTMALSACGSDDPASDATPDATTASTVEATTDAATPTAAATATDDATATDVSGAGVVVALADSDLGPILVDESGTTLYVFDNDDVDTSACADDCLATWPPLEATDVVAGDGVTAVVGTFTRDDGVEQATIEGKPLYYFANDASPGEVGGQGVGDVWWVVDAAGAAVMEPAATPTSASYGGRG